MNHAISQGIGIANSQLKTRAPDIDNNEISVESERLERMQCELQARLETLACRLGPILTPPNLCGAGGDEAVPMTELGQSIRQRTYQAGRMSELVSDLLHRLAL